MKDTNFQMLWTDQAFTLEVNGSTLTGYSAERLDLPSTLVEETTLTAQVHDKSSQRPQAKHMTWIEDQYNYGYGWKVHTSLLKAQGYGIQWRDYLVPKTSYQKPHSQLPSECLRAQPINGSPNHSFYQPEGHPSHQ